MSLIRELCALLYLLTAIWAALCILAFLSGFFLTLVPVPWPWPLPWSDFKNFIETPDGRVLVELRFYNRILCYDSSGNFVTSYRLPMGTKSSRLAVGKDNLVYVRAKNGVHVFSPEWEEIEFLNGDDAAKRVWMLDAQTGKPVNVPERKEPSPRRAVGPGELLFDAGNPPDEFHCDDGSTLRRDWNSLERVSPDGNVTATYGTPSLLKPFVFPLPAVIAWPAIFLLVFLAGVKSRFALKRPTPSTSG